MIIDLLISGDKKFIVVKRIVKFFTCLLVFSQILAVSLYAEDELNIQQEFNVAEKVYSESKFLNRIRQRGRLIIAMAQKDQYPFFYTTKNNSLVGLDVDIAQELAKSLQVDLDIDRSAKSFNDLIPMVAAQQVDMALSKLSRTLQRSQEVLFSKPYIVFRQALLINRIQLARVSASDEETKEIVRNFSSTIGVIANSSYERYARTNFPQAEIVSFPSWEATLQALSDSKVFAVYRDEVEIGRYIHRNPQENLYFKSVYLQDREDPIAVALPAGDYHFLFYINMFLDTLDFLPRDANDLLAKFGEYDEVQ